MAGGVGSRFWPYSRTNNPKQFHDILGVDKTMLQLTVERFGHIFPKENIYVVTNEKYAHLVSSDLPFLQNHQILLEPVAKNTAPCIAYAAYKIHSKNPSANIVVSPADHYIQNVKEFQKTVLHTLSFTQKEDAIVTVGIVPTRPDTGYGYIQFNKDEKREIKKVLRFAEKPNTETALQYLAGGDFVWNSGLFIFNTATIVEAFKTYMPELDTLFGNFTGYYTHSEQDFISHIYPQCPSISFDYAIMEKIQNAYVLQGYFGWSDVGTWKSAHDLAEKDGSNNALDGNILIYNTHNSIIKVNNPAKLVVINGLDGFIVAEYDNVLMICKKDEEQKVKEFVAAAKDKFGDTYI